MAELINKNVIRRHFCIIAILTLLVLLLVVTIKITKPIKDEQVRTSIQFVLDAKEKGKYKIGPYIKSNTAFTSNSYFFELIDTKNRKQKSFVALTKVTGLNGPIALIFIGDTENIQVAGIAGIKNSLEDPMNFGITNTIIQHWSKLLLNIYNGGISK